MLSIKQLYKENGEHYNKQIDVAGWVRTIRDSKTFGFIEINDGSFFRNLQVVFEEGALHNFKEIAKLPQGSSIRVSGVLMATPDAKQPFELKASAIEIEGLCTQDYPLQKKRHSFEFLRTIARLSPSSSILFTSRS